MAPFDGSVASCGYLEAREGSRVSECESHALMPEASEASEGSWFAVTQSRSPQATGGRRYVSLCREVPVRAEGLFEGTTFLYVNGASEDELRGEEDVLETLSKRKSSFTLKGRFKRRVKFSDLLIGHEFNDGVLNPPNWQRKLILGFLNRFFPHLDVKLGRTASALAPVVLECKRLKVSGASGGGELNKCDVVEDTALLGDYFAEKPRSPAERLRYFRRAENLEGHWFEPGLEYTFEFYQNNLSFVDYKLRFGLLSIGIGKIVKGNPVQFLIKDAQTKDYLCYFQFWSERLLRFRQSASVKQHAAAETAEPDKPV
ncbi:hypothetical protein HOP50_10g58430 [Chloropicon primus]|nr:hypothetical protein HOP50_10g58430 [Chloropicon primus]